MTRNATTPALSGCRLNALKMTFSPQTAHGLTSSPNCAIHERMNFHAMLTFVLPISLSSIYVHLISLP